MAGGAALYMTSSVEPHWALAAAAIMVGLVGWIALSRRGTGMLAFALALLSAVGAGALAAQVRTQLVAAPVLREEIGPVRIEGIIAEIDSSERSRRVRIDVRAIERLTPAATPDFVRFSFKGDLGFEPGRAVACRAILSPPPRPVVPGDYAFHRDAWFQQLGGVGFATGGCEPLPIRPPTEVTDATFQWLGAVRRAIAVHVHEAAGEEAGGVAAAMVSGDRSFITPEDSEALRLSGLAHLLSISGVHMVLVGGVVFFIVRFLWPFFEPLALRMPSVRVAAFAAIVACTLYFAISGMEVATQRAYIIALIGFGAKLFDRPAISLRSLAISMGVVVLFQPESVVTPGFQMSFAASGALIALYEVWPRMDKPERPGIFGRLGAWLVGASATSLVASLATLPFALHHFDRAALFSVFANIVSTPVITLWTTPAAALAALAATVGLDEPFLWLMGKSLEVVMAIAHYSAETSPDIDVPRLDGVGMALAAAAIALFCVLARRGRILSILPASAAVAVWFTTPQAVGYVANDGAVFLPQEKAWIEITDWRVENGLDPLIIGDAKEKSPCPGKGQACELTLSTGMAIIEPVTGVASDTCPTPARLFMRPEATAQAIEIDPCLYSGKGGAAIVFDGATLSVQPAGSSNERPWEQPLYRKRPPVEQ
jgi:competence protein ComEC